VANKASLLLIYVLALVEFASAQRYSITELGFLPGGNYTVPSGLNNLGQVVGLAVTSAGQDHAFLWTSSMGMQDLGTLGGTYSQASAINDFGAIVGVSTTTNASNFNCAFVWTKSTGMTLLLGCSPDFQSDAYNINDHGQVVGIVVSTSASAFVWTKSGEEQDLISGVASGINERNEVAGTTESNTAFLWTETEGTQEIGTLGGSQSAAFQINDLGEAVGASITSNGQTHAFIWTKQTGMTDLGTLPGDDFSQAAAINDFGQVVGLSKHGGTERAFVWGKNLGMRDLNTLVAPISGWNLMGAVGINSSGQIAGYGTFNGVGTGFLLTPR
jgi:probable HAF family extracellular repeat protein